MKFTPSPYNPNIGPGGPDMNRVGFSRIRAYIHAKMSPFMAVDQASAVPQSGTMPMAQPTPAPFASNIVQNNPQQLISGSEVVGGRSSRGR